MFRILLIFVLIAGVVYAETLEEIINTALVESPFLKSYSYQVKTVEGEIKRAKSFQNPTVNIGFGRVYSQIEGESGFNITSFSVRQPLRLWGERKYAIHSAKLKKIALDNFYNFQKNILISNLYSLFFSSLAIKERIKVKQQEILTLKELYNFLQKSYQLGEIIQLDVLRAEKELNLAQVELEKLKALLKTSLNTLSSFVGKNIENVEGNLFQFKEIKEVQIEKTPEILYYQTLIKSIDQQIRRQKALSKPRITIGIGADEDEVDLGKYDFGFSVSSTIPVFYRNQGEIIQLVNQKNVLLAKINQTKLNYRAQIDSLSSQELILKSQLEKVDTQLIPAVSKALKIGEKSFKLRTITFFEFSNIRQQYYDSLYYRIQLAEDIQKLYGEYIKIGGLR